MRIITSAAAGGEKGRIKSDEKFREKKIRVGTRRYSIRV